MAEVTLPTKDEIRHLPHWARVAFAARCARRVLPLFEKHWPNAPKQHVDAVSRAVELAENSAASAARDGNAVANAASAISDAGSAALAIFDISAIPVFAAQAAGSAAHTVFAPSTNTAARTAAAAAKAAGRKAIPSIQADFQRLLDESRRNNWTDSTPVPPSVFGPLDELPADPLEADEHVVMALQAFAEPGVSASTLAEYLLATYKALNEYTLAKYGKHLSRGEFRRLVYKHVGVPA